MSENLNKRNIEALSQGLKAIRSNYEKQQNNIMEIDKIIKVLMQKNQFLEKEIIMLKVKSTGSGPTV